MPKNKPILVLDFDGVIHSYTSDWKGVEVIPDPPVPGAMRFIRDAMVKFEINVYSSRSFDYKGLNAMRAYVRFHLDAEFDYDGEAIFDELKWPRFKPAAFMTIDDRGLRFEGVWPDVAELLDFKPWHKRPSVPAESFVPMVESKWKNKANGYSVTIKKYDYTDEKVFFKDGSSIRHLPAEEFLAKFGAVT